MSLDVATTAADLMARYGADADDEARRQLESACDDDRSKDAQHWISVVFFLARNGSALSASTA